MHGTINKIGRRSPSTETNGQSFLWRPGPTKVCRANDDDVHRSTCEVYYILFRI